MDTQHLIVFSLLLPPSPPLPSPPLLSRLPSHLLPEEYGNLQKGDEIIEINGVPIRWQNQEEVGMHACVRVHVYVSVCVSVHP